MSGRILLLNQKQVFQNQLGFLIKKNKVNKMKEGQKIPSVKKIISDASGTLNSVKKWLPLEANIIKVRNKTRDILLLFRLSIILFCLIN